MKILGIDPGIGRVGWGIIDYHSNKPELISVGCFETFPTHTEPDRLRQIYDFFSQLFIEHHPEAIAIEQLFFAANSKTAFTVGQARGVLVLCCSIYGLQPYSYTPLQVKQSMTGYGRADKKQIQMMVKTLLNLDTVPKPDDAADALAIALTHAFSYKLSTKLKNA